MNKNKKNIIQSISILLVFASITVIPSLPVIASEQVKIPIESFASLPDVTKGRLSPDGIHFASLVRIDTPDFQGTAIHILNVDTSEIKLHAATDNTETVIKNISWVNTVMILVKVQFTAYRYNGDAIEQRFMKLNAHTGELKPLIGTDFFRTNSYMPQSQGYVVDYLPEDPEHILLGIKRKPRHGEEVYKISMGEEKPQRVQKSVDYYYGWLSDQQNNVRLATSTRKSTKSEIKLKDLESGKFRTLWKYEYYSDKRVSPLDFDEDPNILFYKAFHNGFFALFKADVSQDPIKGELVHSIDGEDFNGYILYHSRDDRRVVGFYQANNSKHYYWDEEHKKMQATLDHTFPDTSNSFYARSNNDNRLLVYRSSSKDPGAYYLWDRSKKTIDLLAVANPRLHPDDMAVSEAFSFTARDGFEVDGLLTLPAGKALPRATIIYPSSKPSGRHSNEFNYVVQLFASRGFNVIRLNYRKSSGGGLDSLKKGLEEWVANIQNDIEDANQWGIDKGLIQKGKVCIAGVKYGGYVALMSAVENRGQYACAISISGISDLPDMFTDSKRYTSHTSVKKFLGNDSKTMRKLSPVSLTKTIQIPILLIHGADDIVVPASQSEQMYDALKRGKKDVEYVKIEAAGHSFEEQEHRTTLYSALEKFLKNNL
jgi:dipeptidyl aminopeptidase/acylaminoacyl peptidase